MAKPFKILREKMSRSRQDKSAFRAKEILNNMSRTEKIVEAVVLLICCFLGFSIVEVFRENPFDSTAPIRFFVNMVMAFFFIKLAEFIYRKWKNK